MRDKTKRRFNVDVALDKKSDVMGREEGRKGTLLRDRACREERGIEC